VSLLLPILNATLPYEAEALMICLTGDIHHSSLKTNDQMFAKNRSDTEVKITCRYLKILEQYNLKVTFYTTGKTMKREWNDFKPIAESPLVEIGGHTYSGLPRSVYSRMLYRISGKPTVSHSDSHGNYSRQTRDVEKMIRISRIRTGKAVVSWRSHGLVTDSNTYTILKEKGIKFISDDLCWVKIHPERTEEGLISHPINVIMDHDHVYHAHRTPHFVKKQMRNWPLQNDPTSESYYITEWGNIVERQVAAIEKRGGVATVLLHPICMYLADEFKTADRLFKFFSNYTTVWAREVGIYVKEG
jgi:peptidoglycan/xylan/chitin deacetylase (PgdA/CDA1 family)